MPARKNETMPKQGERANAATRAKSKYDAKTYQKYIINCKTVDDSALIAEIEAAKAGGSSPTDYIRALFQKAKAAGII